MLILMSVCRNCKSPFVFCRVTERITIQYFSASFFHDFWKRKQNELEYDWDTADFEMEEVL